ncbi:hypothetical protein PR001_g23910 [Phytophthora rubi]|uniref:Uncharacterized protein n=1 Tax=Phytophthora rubi TaxID=129364 RepID=A0A6A3IIF0_9STRA|nr:hypothetical protein PR001_g23910 [Phytophthora rubi]
MTTETTRKKGKKQAQTAPIQQQALAVRPDWEVYWKALAGEWSREAQTPFPLATSNNDKWRRAAKLEPVRLLQLAQGFPFTTEVLQPVSDDVLITWTATWRQECMLSGLIAYRERSTDKSTRKWLADWIDRIAQPPVKKGLAPLIDISDDWERLRIRAYGDDALLRRCDFGRKLTLAQHILCAILYDKEIRVLTGTDDAEDTSIPAQVRRHLNGLRTIKSYKAAYRAADKQINWVGVERYFQTALEQDQLQVALQH